MIEGLPRKACLAPRTRQGLDMIAPQSYEAAKQNQGGSMPAGILAHVSTESWLSQARIFILRFVYVLCMKIDR